MKKLSPKNSPVEKKSSRNKMVVDSGGLSKLVKKFIYAGALMLIVFSCSYYSIRQNRQFEMMSGMAEEYLALGVNMYYSGTFYLSETAKTPFVFRPPGYVKFLDLVMKGYGGMKPKTYQYQSQEDFNMEKTKVLQAIYFAQCLLITASAVILFLLLSEFSGMILAFLISVAFGINPYLISLAGLVHYETLHIFMMLVSIWMMYLGFSRKKSGLIFLFLSGICWGLTTLVRPVSLIMPALFAIMVAWTYRKEWKRAVLFFLTFCLAFAGTIAPYTYRNYRLMHRFIPVNAQSNINLWAGSHRSLDLDANHYRWWKIWYPDGQEIYEKITGAKEYETAIYADHAMEFEDLYGAKFKENILSHPQTYLGNIVKNFLLLTFGMNSVFIKMFQYLQHHDGEINKDWLASGNPQDFYPSEAANAFSFVMMVMTLMSIGGIFLAIKRGDKLVLIPLMTFLTIAIAHSITYTDLMYFYIRIPFLFIFTAFFIRHLGRTDKGLNVSLIQKIGAFSLAAVFLILFMAVMV